MVAPLWAALTPELTAEVTQMWGCPGLRGHRPRTLVLPLGFPGSPGPSLPSQA